MVEEPNLSSSVTPLDLKGQGKEEVGRGHQVILRGPVILVEGYSLPKEVLQGESQENKYSDLILFM